MSAAITIESLVEQSPGIMSLKDLDEVVIACSKLQAQHCGFTSASGWTGLTDHDIRSDAAEMADQFVNEDKLVFNTGEQRFINICTYADGKKHILLSHKKSIKDNDGNNVAILAHVLDLANHNQLFHNVLALVESDTKKFNIGTTSLHISENFQDENMTLTNRESQCLFYIARGKSIKQIAKLLSLSYKTVERHIYNVRQKLECRTISDLIDYTVSKNFFGTILNNILMTNNVSLLVD